jgi:hypothetical protein
VDEEERCEMEEAEVAVAAAAVAVGALKNGDVVGVDGIAA